MMGRSTANIQFFKDGLTDADVSATSFHKVFWLLFWCPPSLSICYHQLLNVSYLYLIAGGLKLSQSPFCHCEIPDFVEDTTLLQSLQKELNDLEFAPKNNDLYKFLQVLWSRLYMCLHACDDFFNCIMRKTMPHFYVFLPFLRRETTFMTFCLLS